MAGEIEPRSYWELHNSQAKLRCGLLAGSIDLSRPELGLDRLAIDGQPREGRIVGIRPDGDSANPSPPSEPSQTHVGFGRLADSYVRGADLVATYDPNEDWPYTSQVYWSATPVESADHVLSSLSMFVSLQTHLLDTWPKLNIGSRLATDQILFVTCDSHKQSAIRSLDRGHHVLQPTTGACCLLQRLSGSSLSYAEIMPASDFRELAVWHSAEGHCQTSWELFADFLEKGVIRRARMQSAFLHRNHDQECAEFLCPEIEHRPLPLTA